MGCQWIGRSAFVQVLVSVQARIREVSIGIEEYSPYLDRELDDIKYFDAGDIPLPFGNPERSIGLIEEYRGSGVSGWQIPIRDGGRTFSLLASY